MNEQVNQFHQERSEKRIGNYIIDKTVGKGTFGKVKLGIHTLTGQKVAIKILEKQRIIDVADVERVIRQIHILKLIRHPNIIQLYEIIQTPKHLFLVMQYMEGGQVFHYVKKKKKRMNQDEACKVFEQIISGIQYIHKLRVVHRDLKLENLLMDYDKTIKIIDFGLSNTYKIQQKLRTACGSPCYAAPQMIQMIESNRPYQPIMVDLWSAGVILYTMVCGYFPFEDDETPKLYKKIVSGQYTLPNTLSPELQDFIQKILTVDPKLRIGVQGIKQHPWWKKYSNNYYPEGLIVGYHKMPIQPKILLQLQHLNIDIENTQKCIQANRHNNQTTTYYLLLKKYLREGNISKADFSGKYFDREAIEPNKRKERKHSLKAEEILKKQQSKEQKRDKVKSFYKQIRERNQNESFAQRSIKIKKRYIKQPKSKSKSKLQSQTRNESLTRQKSIHDNHINNQHQKNKKITKISNRSSSKRKRQLKNISLIAEQTYKPKLASCSNTAKNKKSHQGSYLIGNDTATDWPLEPKWKIENTSKNKQKGKKK